MKKNNNVIQFMNYQKFAELICLSLAFIDNDSVARLPIDVVDIIENIIKLNNQDFNFILNSFGFDTLDNNSGYFKVEVEEAFKKYVNSQSMWIDFSKSIINIPYESNEDVAVRLIDFDNDVFSQGLSLAKMIKDYSNFYRNSYNQCYLYSGKSRNMTELKRTRYN